MVNWRRFATSRDEDIPVAPVASSLSGAAFASDVDIGVMASNDRHAASIGSMRCPRCTIAMSPVATGLMGSGTRMFYNDAQAGHHTVNAVACPECRGVFMTHNDSTVVDGPERGSLTSIESNEQVLMPRVSSGSPVPPELPEPYASLAREAGLVLVESPRARAPCRAGACNLFSARWRAHDLREIGNMAAHPKQVDSDG